MPDLPAHSPEVGTVSYVPNSERVFPNSDERGPGGCSEGEVEHRQYPVRPPLTGLATTSGDTVPIGVRVRDHLLRGKDNLTHPGEPTAPLQGFYQA